MRDDCPGTRRKAIELLSRALECDGLCKKIEAAAFNMSLASFPANLRYWEYAPLRKKYCDKILSLKYNLSDPRNPDLKKSVVDAVISAQTLVKMTCKEMFPAHWDTLYDMIATKQLRRQLTNDPEKCPDGAFTCRCGSKKTVFTLLQTRSADEPMTAFIQCIACGKRWKQ